MIASRYANLATSGVVWLPGRILERTEGGDVVRAPSEPAPPLLSLDETIRLLRLDDGSPSAEAAYQKLKRLRDSGRLHAVTGIGNQLRYALSEVLRVIEDSIEGDPR